MIVYRLSTTEYINDLSGKGAGIFGGRWNSKGLSLLYTCESRALCITEIAVHTPLGIVPLDYSLCFIEIPENSPILEISNDDLPLDWRSFPHAESTQILGNKFIREKKHLVLKVPSAVVPGEYNYLINPSHSNFNTIRIIKTEAFLFDERLFK